MLRTFHIPQPLPSSILGLLYVLVLSYLNRGIVFLNLGLIEVQLLARIIRITVVGMLVCLKKYMMLLKLGSMNIHLLARIIRIALVDMGKLCHSSWRMLVSHWQARREMLRQSSENV